MVYLDNAATTGTKPLSVQQAVNDALKNYSVNPGRGGYALARRCDRKIYECRKKAAELFGCDDESNVIFMPNCTTAINTVIKGVLKKGDHTVVSSLEHNAVMRPLAAVMKNGIEADAAEVIFDDPEATVRSFVNKLKSNTKLVICTHASNVTGHIMPVKEIGKECRKRGILFAVDAAQTAGVIEIDMREMNIDYLCIAAHKGLYAPSGIGMLIARAPIANTIIEGGTGTESLKAEQPFELPERFESGTQSVSGIFGLSAGIDFVRAKGVDEIYRKELALADAAYDGLSHLPGVIIYSGRPSKGVNVPTLSFNLRDYDCDSVAEYLDADGICVRSGLHCAPCAHRSIGTAPNGTVRISFSAFNTVNDVSALIRSLSAIRMRRH